MAASIGCGGARVVPLSKPRSQRIVIVGAGISGLVAAGELVKHGYDVMVIEATDRPGGRIRTVRGFPDGMYAEAGAMHLVADPDLIAVIQEAGIETRPGPKRVPLARIHYVRGERRVYKIGQDEPPDHVLSAEETALDRGALMKRYFGIVGQIDPHAMVWTGEVAKLDQQTCANYLRGLGASPGFIAEVDDMMPIGEGVETISALDVARVLAAIRYESSLPPPPGVHGGRLAGGADSLPRALAARLGDRVVYRTALVRIERDVTDSEQMLAREPGQRTGVTLVVGDGQGQHNRVEAARVVLTMPFTVLRGIDVAPRWSPLKARAIAELGMTAVTRIWVATDRRYWEDQGEAGRADSDLPTGDVHDEADGLPGTAGLLGVYANGPRAHRLAALAPDARIAALTADVEKIHPAASGHIVHGDSVAWETEPFTRGAYAAFKPGQLTSLAAAASAREGPIHFAGCGTSHRPGFMHGAIASAKRAVAEILDEDRKTAASSSAGRTRQD